MWQLLTISNKNQLLIWWNKILASKYLTTYLLISNFLFHDKWPDQDESNTDTPISCRTRVIAMCEYQLCQEMKLAYFIGKHYKSSQFESEIKYKQWVWTKVYHSSLVDKSAQVKILKTCPDHFLCRFLLSWVFFRRNKKEIGGFHHLEASYCLVYIGPIRVLQASSLQT